MHTVICYFHPCYKGEESWVFSKDISLHDKLGILPTVKEISLESSIKLSLTWQLIIFQTLIMKYRIQKNSCPMTSTFVIKIEVKLHKVQSNSYGSLY